MNASTPSTESTPPPVRSPRFSLLFAVELLAVGCFCGLVLWRMLLPTDAGALAPIDPAALATGPASESWMAIYFEDQPVGFSVSSQVPTTDGGLLIQGRSLFRMVNMGQLQKVVTAGSALMDGEGRLLRFDVLWDAEQVRLVARGQVEGDELVLEVHQGGELQTLRLPLEAPPQIGLSFGAAIAREPLQVGRRFSLSYFDPLTLSQSAMQVVVTGVEVLSDGEESYWVQTTVNGIQTRRLVTPAGDILREEGAWGLSMVRTTREEAQRLLDEGEPVDFIAMASIIPRTPIPDSFHTARLTLVFSGVEAERIPDEPPVQRRIGDQVTITMPLEAELPATTPLLLGTAAEGLDPSLVAALASEPFLPAVHPEVLAAAAEITAGTNNRRDAARRVADWVFTEVEKRPVVGVPNGLEVLHSKVGDCNEHTALYVTLARAAGVPARIAAGLVYSDRITEQGAFFYHAWPEVFLGGEVGWVPIDPTFGQFPADATHLKLVEGNLDRQVEIISVIGRLHLEPVTSPPKAHDDAADSTPQLEVVKPTAER